MRSEHVALGFIKTGVENLHNCSELAAALDILPLKKFFLMAHPNFPCFSSLHLLPSCHALQWRVWLHLPWHLQALVNCCRIPLKPALLQAGQSPVPQVLLQGKSSSPCVTSAEPWWALSLFAPVCPSVCHLYSCHDTWGCYGTSFLQSTVLAHGHVLLLELLPAWQCPGRGGGFFFPWLSTCFSLKS